MATFRTPFFSSSASHRRPQSSPRLSPVSTAASSIAESLSDATCAGSFAACSKLSTRFLVSSTGGYLTRNAGFCSTKPSSTAWENAVLTIAPIRRTVLGLSPLSIKELTKSCTCTFRTWSSLSEPNLWGRM
ncbi:MAG TPA: hypothetical protein VGE01_00460 [Fimbriimonas sp.]